MNATISFFILTTFFGIIEIVRPIRWEWLRETMSWVDIPFTPHNIIITLSALSIILPVLFSLTPWQHNYLRSRYKCQEPTPEEKARMEKALQRIREKTGKPEGEINLYVNPEEKDCNAFTIGNRDIVVTKLAIKSLSDDELAAFMAHEAGHIVNRDAIPFLLNYTLYNTGETVMVIYILLHEGINLLRGIPFIGWTLFLPAWILNLFIHANTYILNMPQEIITKYGARHTELAADLFACQAGFADGLEKALEKSSLGDKPDKTHVIYHTHPPYSTRIHQIRRYKEEHHKK